MGRINQLAEKTTLNSTDVIAVDAGAGGNTNKMTGANLAGQLKALGNYQDKLTFDSTPTAGSANPVTSGGVKTALDGKQNTLTFDSAPTAGSANPVTSGGIATAIAQSTASMPKRIVGTIAPRNSVQIPIKSDYSANTEFILLCINFAGNALGGSALVFLGRGTGKYKDLIGSMSSASYSLAYANNSWTLTNETTDATIFYTCIASW